MYERHIGRRTLRRGWGEFEECDEVLAFPCPPAARHVTGVLKPVERAI